MATGCANLDFKRTAGHFITMLKTRATSFVLPALLLLTPLAGCNRSPEAAQANRPAADYAYGTKLLFGKNGNAEPAKASGWHAAEAEFTWTEANSAVLALRVPAHEGGATLNARMAGMINPPTLPAQLVQVYVNDKMVGEWKVADTAEFSASIPRNLTKEGGVLKIEFKVPQANSPKELGISEDARKLGVRLYDLDLQKSS